MLVARNGAFLSYDLATQSATPLSHFPTGDFVASPALSPDRKRVVYTYYLTPKDPSAVTGSDLYLMGVDGSNAQLLRSHGTGQASYESPCWTPDGQAILATLRAPTYVGGQYKGTTTTIQRVNLTDPAHPVFVTTGQNPTLSSDGASLAYLIMDAQNRWHLLVAQANGTNPVEIPKQQGFAYVASPQFAPKAPVIAFAGAGLIQQSATRKTLGERVLDAFAPPVEADGTPADIWLVQADGSNPRQITHTQDHTPMPAWSPDGTWLAVASEMGLALVDATGQNYTRLRNGLGISGLVWLD